MPGRMRQGLLDRHGAHVFQDVAAEMARQRPSASDANILCGVRHANTARWRYVRYPPAKLRHLPAVPPHHQVTSHHQRLFIRQRDSLSGAVIAARVGASPIRPEVAATTISTSGCVATSSKPSSPSTTRGKAARAASQLPGIGKARHQ